MSAKRRSQIAYLILEAGKVDFIPIGTFQVYIDYTHVKNGTINFSGRIINSNIFEREQLIAKGRKRDEDNRAS